MPKTGEPQAFLVWHHGYASHCAVYHERELPEIAFKIPGIKYCIEFIAGYQKQKKLFARQVLLLL